MKSLVYLKDLFHLIKRSIQPILYQVECDRLVYNIIDYFGVWIYTV